MNISNPVASAIQSVDFCFLSPKEIQAISTKRIENENTFDSLLNPAPGGLYDPALGAWGDSPCATCYLSKVACPGHPGHIDLPVPVYHPVFLDQVLRLLRAQCIYCRGFRFRRQGVHLFVCKLKLLRRGLVREARLVDTIGEEDSYGGGMLTDLYSEEHLELDKQTNAQTDRVIFLRDAFVRRSLRDARRADAAMPGPKHEGGSQMRREVIADFFTEIRTPKRCASCGCVSPQYRKDRYVKIFEKPLTPKDLATAGQKGLRPDDAIARVRAKSQRMPDHPSNGPGLKAVAYHSDEGVADVGSPSNTAVHPNDVPTSSASAHRKANDDEDDDTSSLYSVVMDADSNTNDERFQADRFISSMEVRARLVELFEAEREILSLVYSARPPPRGQEIHARPSADMFFITTLLVPPNRFRPEALMDDSKIAEAEQNSLYRNIIRNSVRIGDIHRAFRQTDKEVGSDAPARISQLFRVWTELQESVNSLIDAEKNPLQGISANLKAADGIKQKLEKKEGLFRMNMMGKRVNYAARTVISPDPNLETNEIGVPPVFAQKLTYPEPVTSHNFRDLQQAVINGVQKWPGASAIENENGQLIHLRSKSLDERISLANQLLTPPDASFHSGRNKKVHRHLANGDVVLMNRQPTLHRPSIMGHRVRVLPGEKTLRMHYANCNAYNADFDGDEMNMHFPQNELARVEALQLADTDHHYVSTTQGSPLRGLIQDHISISVALCNRDTFFDRGAYHQLLYNALRPESGHIPSDRLKLVRPAILRPRRLWTGKQVISTLLLNLTPLNCGGLWLQSKSKISASEWGRSSAEEGTVLVKNGDLVTGILDKAQIGPSSGGLIHAVHEVYGPATAGKFLSSLGRLLTKFLQMRAFTCGMEDLRLTPEGERTRKRLLAKAGQIGLDTAVGYVSLKKGRPDDGRLAERLEEVARDDSKLEGLDMLMIAACNGLKDEVMRQLMPGALSKPFPRNHMQTMTMSGAKGSSVNATLISCNLGQQSLEGRRVPLMASGRSLPCFEPFDPDARAGGFVVGRFLTGISPQEYFFHLMTGREGLIDTAVKTSRSGYLQRCMIKALEGLTVAYDSTVRDADGSVVQFLFGEDGVDVAKARYLADFDFTLRNLESGLAQFRLGPELYAEAQKSRGQITKHMKSAIKMARQGDGSRAKDPANSVLDPARFLFSTSEQFFEAMTDFVKNNEGKLMCEKKEKEKEPESELGRLGRERREVGPVAPGRPVAVQRKMAETLFAVKYSRSLVQPGEAVGIVAGQSLGEPSTQMTLNTFHLAGHSGRNVTLGIPRLREILMTASLKIATPTMALYMREQVTAAEAERFAKALSILPLGYLVDRVVAKERIGGGTRIYDVRIHFFPLAEYGPEYAITGREVMDAMELKFIRLLLKLIRAEMRKRGQATPNIGVPTAVAEAAATVARSKSSDWHSDQDTTELAGGNVDGDGGEGGSDADADEDDDDATTAKQRGKQAEAMSYGPNDPEDEAVQRKLAREADDEFLDEGFASSPTASPSSAGAVLLGDGNDSDGDQEVQQRQSESGRGERVKNAFKEVTRFECDEDGGGWCRFTLTYDAGTPKILVLDKVQEAVRKAVVRQVAGVRTCSYVAHEGRDGKGRRLDYVHVQGVNIGAAQARNSLVETARIGTNDIAAVLARYGVEACRAAVVRELALVFGSHSITVDARHLSLVADFMTRAGGFTPFNRSGLGGIASPLTKMSFETTVAFLKDAVLDGDWDELLSPSSRLVVGKLAAVGTGCFDILTRVPTIGSVA